MTREEAIKKMQAVKAHMTSGNPIWGVTEMGEAFDMAIKALEEQSIRCKDCKHWEGEKRGQFWYFEQCSLNQHVASCDDYCSFAERKEGEADADD